jgi:flagellar biosynthesis/type III secretory pathway ATPase
MLNLIEDAVLSVTAAASVLNFLFGISRRARIVSASKQPKTVVIIPIGEGSMTRQEIREFKENLMKADHSRAFVVATHSQNSTFEKIQIIN